MRCYVDQKPLTDFFSRHQLIHMVVADLSSGETWAYGDLTRLTPNGVASLASDLLNLDRSLSGQILPTSYAQGKEACFVTKPSSNTIALLFFFSSKEFFEEIQWGKEMDRELRRLVQ